MMERGEKRILRVFKRLETDAEFRKRLDPQCSLEGAKLDDWFWSVFKQQRKIIDDVA